MEIYALDHVQIAMPAGREEQARVFYGEILGLQEIPKPPELAQRGGCWFMSGALKLHLGVEENFRPARKAHPAFLVHDLDGLLERCRQQDVEMKVDVPLPGFKRMHIFDPFGNRIELLENIGDDPLSGGSAAPAITHSPVN